MFYFKFLNGKSHNWTFSINLTTFITCKCLCMDIIKKKAFLTCMASSILASELGGILKFAVPPWVYKPRSALKSIDEIVDRSASLCSRSDGCLAVELNMVSTLINGVLLTSGFLEKYFLKLYCIIYCNEKYVFV